MALWHRCLQFSCFLAESFAANHPLIIVPGLTGSGLEVKEHDAPMPHSFCKTGTRGKWMKVWVSPVFQLQNFGLVLEASLELICSELQRLVFHF